ncbi:MAG: 30S ribosomal protein S20 [Myxococcota bacterium]|nr:30S ribosomal protein S20 [Myxococcota bacterium]MDW8360977.1 30S ribosomal protein S20 [Myxococcales bacterium]
MANHASAEKRHRQTIARTARRRSVRTAVRTWIKRVRAAIARGDRAEAQKLLREAARRIDMAVSKGVFHRNTGSRYISRLSQRVAAMR